MAAVFLSRLLITGLIIDSSKAIQDPQQLADPSIVAADGYEALMKNKDKIISGFKNKAGVAMNNLMPDAVAADKMKENLEPEE